MCLRTFFGFQTDHFIFLTVLSWHCNEFCILAFFVKVIYELRLWACCFKFETLFLLKSSSSWCTGCTGLFCCTSDKICKLFYWILLRFITDLYRCSLYKLWSIRCPYFSFADTIIDIGTFH